MRITGTLRRWQGSEVVNAVPGPNGGFRSSSRRSKGLAAFRRRWVAVSEPVKPAPTTATRGVSVNPMLLAGEIAPSDLASGVRVLSPHRVPRASRKPEALRSDQPGTREEIAGCWRRSAAQHPERRQHQQKIRQILDDRIR